MDHFLITRLYRTEDNELAVETRVSDSVAAHGYAYVVLSILDTAINRANKLEWDLPVELQFARKLMADLLQWNERPDARRQVIEFDPPAPSPPGDPPPLGSNGRNP